MQNKIAYMSDNAVDRVPPRATPAAWPPPWLSAPPQSVCCIAPKPSREPIRPPEPPAAGVAAGDQVADVVIRAEVVGDELLLHCPTPELAAKIEEGRSRIEQVLDEMWHSEPAAPDHSAVGPCPWDAAEEPGPPCPECGSLEVWWDLLGGRHCQTCDGTKVRRAVGLRERAERIRRVHLRRMNP
jgi:hypothetical protein